MSDIYDVIIIGTGPAGYTAAIYTSRGNLKTLVFDGPQPGGQLTTTTKVENFPGFEDGIQGPELMKEMRAQAERFGTDYVNKKVDKVDFSARPFRVWAGQEEYQAKAVIITTGSKPRKLGLESEEKFWSKGVSSCATCDGFFFKNKTVAVIGGGDSAMEEGTFLTKFAEKVYIIHRRDEFKASEIMLKRAQDNNKVEILINKAVEEVLGDDHVTGLRLKDTETGETSELKVDGMFLAIGHTPATDPFKDEVELDDHGYIVHKKHTMTSLQGVFAGGDCVDSRYRQAITAAGQGCRAAMDTKRWLDDNE